MRTVGAERGPSRVGEQARDAVRVVAFGFGSARALAEPTEVTPIYRWGWLPLIGGCAAIVAALTLLSEMVLARFGYVDPDSTRRVLLVARTAITSGLLAIWAGWFVLRTRRRIEDARLALLARRRELETQAVRAEQVAGLGALSRILAHEIRNPLNTIAIHCALLDRRAREMDGAAEPLRGSIDVLRDEIARIKHLVDDYIAYGRAGQVEVHAVAARLELVARRVVDAARKALQEKDLTLTVDAPEDLPPVRADEERIADALYHLLCRSREASPRGSAIRLQLRDDERSVSLTIRDEGSAFADPAAVFRPFFSGDDPGASFGLAIVRDIVRAHGGEIHAGNDPNGGRFIVMRIPRASP